MHSTRARHLCLGALAWLGAPAWLGCGSPAPPAVAPTPASEVAGPLRLFSHADPPAEVLVFDHRRSRDLVASLGPVLDAVNGDRAPGAPAVELTVLQWRRDRGAARVTTRATPVRRVEVETRFDVWLQDFAELALAPAAGRDLRLVLVDPNRGAGLERVAPELALRWRARWVRLPRPPRGAASGAGNVEALPGGWLLIGSTAGEAMVDFWLERGFRERHVRLDTSWLAVGHVDEIVSHVITGPGACDFAIVRASPARALESAAADPDPPRWLRRKRPLFAAQQRALDTRIAAGVEVVRRALAPACPRIAVVEIPVLFRCRGEADAPEACVSERPNSVNMTVLGRHLLIPDPRYAPFESETRSALEAVGQRVHLLDADAQHDRKGGLHCATAVRRVARAPTSAAATLAP